MVNFSRIYKSNNFHDDRNDLCKISQHFQI